MIRAFIIDRIRSLLVPELADLRQQLADARRLAGEAQGRYRVAELDLKISADARDHYKWRATEAAKERDEQRQRADKAEQMGLDQLSKTTDALNRLAAATHERDQLRARVVELEAGIGLYRAVGFPSDRPAGQSEIEARLAVDAWEAERHMKEVTP